MTDLTEQWKKGELPSGWYYVKNEFGNIFPSDYSEDYDYISDTVIKDFFTEVSEIKEVIEPVPSYEEYQKLLSDQLAKNEGEEINAELEHRLAMVKANGKYPDRISRLKSRVVALSEENSNLKSKLQLKETAYDFDTARLEEENTKLKELLKECKTPLEVYNEMFGNKEELLTKIDEVLKC